jgi:hypothetical protein
MVFNNDKIPVLQRRTVHTKNSLGFRGPEKPEHFSDRTSIIAIGGSATECFYLDDKTCWTNLLADKLSKYDSTIWINNAGYQGHSSYGHDVLINDYIKYIKPDHILFMAGFNEIDRYDIMNNESVSRQSAKNNLWGWLKRNSELVILALNIERHMMADRLAVTDGHLNLKSPEVKHLTLSQFQVDSAISVQKPLIESYRLRLKKIVDTCRTNNINLILVTQPILLGSGIDSISGQNLETVESRPGYNGLLTWKLLEEYNNVTRLMAYSNKLLLIDLARELPKSSAYFYDICHFTEEGSERVSEILSLHIAEYLKKTSGSIKLFVW